MSGLIGTRRALGSALGGPVTRGQRPPISSLLKVGAGLAVALLLAQMSLHGASTTWNGGQSKKETDWNTKQNWSGNVVPTVNDLAVFTTSAYSPSLTANSYIGGLQFNSGANSFTIGGTYTLSISNQNIVVNSANAQTINAPLALVANQTWNAASGNLTIGGTVNLNSYTLTLQEGASQRVALKGIVSGTGGLTQSGSGTVSLEAANTYSGATTINAGKVQLGVANGIGSSSAVTVGASGTLDLNNYNDTIKSLSGAGNVTLGSGTLTVGNGSATTYSGVMSGTGGLNVSGGTLTLSGNNTYSGAVTVGSGATLNAGHANALGSGTAGLAVSGTLSLNANPSSSRPVTMNAGSILNANNKSGSFGGLAVAGNSTINLVNDSTSGALSFGAATRTAGTLTVNNWANTTTRDKIFLTSAGASFLANTVFAGSGQTSSALWGGAAPYELVPYGVTPVPEPQAYAAVLGLGALGFVIYRRRFSAKA